MIKFFFQYADRPLRADDSDQVVCAHQPTMQPMQPPMDTPRACEHGLGLVEVIVVLVIVGMLAGIGLVSLSSGHDRANLTKARSAARSLGEGIEQFQRDHGGRLPSAPGGRDWDRQWRSPVDSANGNKPYVRAGAVEPLATGAAALEDSRGRTHGTPQRNAARIRYLVDPANGLYGLVVRTADGNRWRNECHVTNADGRDGAGRRFMSRLGGSRSC